MSLRILRQTSLSTEKYTQDGKQKSVQVVLKDKPFLVEVGLVRSKDSTADLKTLLLEANLLYDSPEKEVDWIKVKPFEYTAKVNADGHASTLECFIRILSSQNENALFRIRIRALHSATRKPIEGLEVCTDPIQVISKPSVLRKKLEREKSKISEAFEHPHSPVSHGPPGSSSSKRAREDVIIDTLNVIKEQQAAQHRLIEQLMRGGGGGGGAAQPLSAPPSPAESDSSYEPEPQDRIATRLATRKRGAEALTRPAANAAEDEDSFDAVFRQLLGIYNAMPAAERSTKVRKVLRATPAEDYSNLVDTLWTAAFERNMEADGQQRDGGDCIKRDPASEETPDLSELFPSDLPLSLLMGEH